MPVCPNCGRQLADGSLFCGACGVPINQVPQQQQVNPQWANVANVPLVCAKCGKALPPAYRGKLCYDCMTVSHYFEKGFSCLTYGLHEREFIETRRHWFTEPVAHDTCGGVNVLNLVEGEEATVESPTGAFAPFTVHYAETFIVPAAVGKYVVRPSGPGAEKLHATIKAYVRT